MKEEANCEKCGGKFTKIRSSHKYCSKQCKNSVAKKKMLNKLKNGDGKEVQIQRQLLSRTKCKAIKRGIYFDLQPEDIPLPRKCPVLGIPLGFCCGDNSYSIDRIDSRGDYTKDNVIIISWRANHLKNNATKEELQKIASWLEKVSKE